MARVRTLDCILSPEWGRECRGIITAQHLQGVKYRGMGQKASDFETIPLCQHGHHQTGPNSIEVMGQEKWEVRYGTQAYWLEITREVLKRVYPSFDVLTGRAVDKPCGREEGKVHASDV